MSKKWNLIIDLASCSNCGNCVLAVKDEYVGNDFPGYSAPQPVKGHKWFWVDRDVRGSGGTTEVVHIPKSCNHCDDAPCRKAASDAVIKRDDGIVVFDPVKAKGRRDLVDACPYGAVSWNDEADLPQIWSFDAHLLDMGWREPRPVQACPTGCLTSVRASDAEMAARAIDEKLEVLQPELGTRPRLYYRNAWRANRVFVAGNVVQRDDRGRQANAVGANVVMTLDGGNELRTTADAFGDFKFDGVVPGEHYDLAIETADGRSARCSGIADVCIDLGSIELT